MNTDLLIAVADRITTGMELCGSRWKMCEAEVIALQAICSCRKNLADDGEAISWAGPNLMSVCGGGVVDNGAGLQKLVDEWMLLVEPYEGDLSPPINCQRDADGKPLVLRVTGSLLQYVDSFIDGRSEMPDRRRMADKVTERSADK